MLKSLTRGKEGEQKVIDLLKQVGIECVQSEGKVLSHDIHCSYYIPKIVESDISSNINITVLGLKRFSVEVKNDLYATRSGNIAIEYFNSKSNKPSGITATKANIWAHIVNNEIYFASVNQLKDFLNQNKPLKIIEGGGDDNADLFLYRIEDILPIIFIKMDIIPTNQIIKTITDLLNKTSEA